MQLGIDGGHQKLDTSDPSDATTSCWPRFSWKTEPGVSHSGISGFQTKSMWLSSHLRTIMAQNIQFEKLPFFLIIFWWTSSSQWYQLFPLVFFQNFLISYFFFYHNVRNFWIVPICTLWSCPQSSRMTIRSSKIQMGIIDTTNLSWSTRKLLGRKEVMILCYYEPKHVNYTKSDNFFDRKKWKSLLSRKVPFSCSWRSFSN